MNEKRKSYPSDVSDEEWAFCVRYLALMTEDAPQREHPLREVFNALRYQIRVGGAWRMMPHDLPPWHVVYQQAQRWIKAGCFEAMAHDLRAILRLALERKADPSAVILDSDPAFVERTWASVMEQLQSRGKDSSRERYACVFRSPSFDGIRHKKLLETTAEDFFAVFKQGKVAITCFLKRLHNFALSLGWIALPIVAPYLWPKYEAKPRRGITLDEQQSVLAIEKKAEWKLFLELLWETGAAQSDAANLTTEHIDQQSHTITYFRMKTGSRAQFTISKSLERVLQQLPSTGPLFPNLSKFSANDRASRFRRRCERAGVSGVTLHSYRYAWAERAKVVGMPERFAQAALGHNSKAIHRAYAKQAQIIVPSLEDYETRAAATLQNAVAA